MKDTLVLIKLGGSLVTDKTKPMTFRHEYVEQIAEDFRKFYGKMQETDFILGNGAGSFGHFPAHEYGLREGVKTRRQQFGIAFTHNAVQKLSGMVAQVFTDKELPVFCLSPSALFTAHDGKIASAHLAPLEGLLAQGIMPLVHGDGMFDDVRGGTIFSTEKILQACTDHLRTQYEKVIVLYLLNVDGVLDAEGQLISELKAHDEIAVYHEHDHDVTGGIIGKVTSARLAAKTADGVYIANGTVPQIVSRILGGEPLGTRVLG
jgi:isopentenyl phosphate kinase